MRLLHFNRSSKAWLISSILVLIVNLIIFGFQKHIDKNIVFFVVLLTPVAWLGLYFLSKLFFEKSSQDSN
jgi:hypothetical protein